MRDPPSRYGFPPLNGRPLPDEIPWDTPISELSELWLIKECDHCGTHRMPLRLIAAQRGWDLTLRTICANLACPNCFRPTKRATLTDDPAGNEGRHGAKPKYLVLLEVGKAR